MTTTALPDVFRNAADIIGERGWTRGADMHPKTGAVCTNGALRLACGSTVSVAKEGFFHLKAPGDLVRFSRTMRAAHRVLDDRLDQIADDAAVYGIFKAPKAVVFNDKFAEDVDEVTELLRDTADWLESHPLSTLAQIEDAPINYTITPAGMQALKAAVGA